MRPSRLGTFDALRGLAAIAVVLFHLEEVRLTGPVLPHAFLAVDFFFALSGFVIAYTYEDKLRRDLSIGAFLMRRMIRLYPMIVLGVCFGTLVLGAKLLTDPTRIDPPAQLLATFLANLLVLPTPYATPASRGVLFLTDAPLWSVAFEIFVNAVWCIALVRASLRSLVAIVGLCLACLVLGAMPTGRTDIGFDWMTASSGFVRVGYGFGLGLLIYRLRPRLVLARSTMAKIAGGALLLGMFALPRIAACELAVDIACLTLLIPLIVVLGLNGTDHARIDRALGDISYPLYAIHFPILLLASGVHQKVPQLGIGPLLLGTGVIMALATVMVTRLYDEPTRRALAVWWAAREKAKASPPPAAYAPVPAGQ